MLPCTARESHRPARSPPGRRLPDSQRLSGLPRYVPGQAQACRFPSASSKPHWAEPCAGLQTAAPQTSEVGSLTELSYFEGKKRLQVQVCTLPHWLSYGTCQIARQQRRLTQDHKLHCVTGWCVQTADLADGTKALRSLDWDRDRFDIEFGCGLALTT